MSVTNALFHVDSTWLEALDGNFRVVVSPNHCLFDHLPRFLLPVIPQSPLAVTFVMPLIMPSFISSVFFFPKSLCLWVYITHCSCSVLLHWVLLIFLFFVMYISLSILHLSFSLGIVHYSLHKWSNVVVFFHRRGFSGFQTKVMCLPLQIV